MDIPQNDKVPHIRNIHPSQMISAHSYGTIQDDDYIPITRTHSTISERIGDFVGSYSRTSMTFMAENLAVPNGIDDEEDKISTSSASITKIDSSTSHLMDNPTLVFSHLDKVLSTRSIGTVADDYRFETPVVKKSSYTQSIFNTVNILIGIGILALPLGFKCAGWAIGTMVFLFCCGLTNYTAKVLQKCLDLDPESRTYGDMGALAFGSKGRIWITALFLTELMTGGIALVILLGDGIESLFPGFSLLETRIVSFFILTPMLFLPVRHLSYSSLLGIVSAFSILLVMVVDGVTKTNAPGSLIEPSDTEIWPSHWASVPLSFGLIMAGFTGHAVFPTVYRDMETPQDYNKVVNWTYVTTTIVYFAVAACGYTMFGSNTMQEITQNIVSIPEYNQALNRLAVWLIAMNPIAKYGLTVNPVNLSWQLWLLNGTELEKWCEKGHWREPMLTGIGKITTSVFIVGLAYIIPGFDKVMSFVGAFFSFMISGIFPLACHVTLFHDLPFKTKLLNYILIVVASIMAIIGTIWSFI